MPYTTNQTFDPTPNTAGTLEIATSFNPNLLDEALNEGGYGSLINRSFASQLLYYWYAKYPFDQLYQIFAGFDTTDTGKWEFSEADMLLDYSADGVLEDAADVINNTTGGTPYVPAADARYVVADEDRTIYAIYDIVRYENDTGDWTYAWITGIDDASVEAEIQVTSIDGGNLPEAAADDTPLQRIAPNLPQDLDYAPQPKQSDPEQYIALTQNYRRETSMTNKFEAMNNSGGTLVDLIDHYANQLSENFRRDRETDVVLGSGEQNIITIANGDKAQFQSGIYNQTRDDNLHMSDLKTGGQFDADKFKNAMHEFMLRNYGGESGGPSVRDFYVDPVMQSYFDRAWEDRQRFMTGEYVAGVSVTRFSQTGKIMDIIEVPSWSEIHPIPDAQLRGGANVKGAGLLFPMDADHLVRVQQTGLGPRQEVFKISGGDRVGFQRIESNETAVRRLRQHYAAFEEADEA